MMVSSARERLDVACVPSDGTVARIALDTNCVQYYLSNPPVQPWADCLDPVFRAGVAGTAELYVSTVVVAELLAHAHFANRHRAGYDAELDLLAILNRHFRVLPVDGVVAAAAGRLRGNYVPGDRMSLTTPDALIGGTSLSNSHTLFVTNDERLADAFPTGTCIFLREVALEWIARQFPGQCLANQDPVKPRSRGIGLGANLATAAVELGSVQPDPSAKWDRVLANALDAAGAINSPCVFVVLTARGQRRWDTREVIFWHPALDGERPTGRIVQRVREHLGYSRRTGVANNGRHRAHVFLMTSLARARASQGRAEFKSKRPRVREADAWNEYLGVLRLFGDVLSLPQTDCLLCEDGVARQLDGARVASFLRSAGGVLGWETRP